VTPTAPPTFSPSQLGDENAYWTVEANLDFACRFGQFFLVAEENSDEDAPRHLLKCTRLSDPMIESAFVREVSVLKRLAGSRYFPRILHAFRTTGPFPYLLGCIVMTYASDGCLSTLAEEQLTDEERLVLTVGMADALAAFHAQGFIHEDVRLPNFVRTSDGTVQLIDFQSSWSKEDPPQRLSPLVPAFESPEGRANVYHGQESDAWALGASIWSLWECTKRIPPFVEFANTGERIPFTCSTPPNIREVICGLMKKDHEERMTAQEAVIALRALLRR
jgi:serine/threonine protein kinase